MNANSFRLIFSKRLGMRVPVAEQHSAQGKVASEKAADLVLKPLAFSLALLCAAPALALPGAPTVANGSATFSQRGSTLTVTNTPNAIINWGSFSIGRNELTKFIQQSSASAVLNRVTGQSPSQILGQLQSNGRVFLINPNGIVFDQGARIDTAGLIASTLNLGDADFLAGKLRLTGTGSEGKVENQGTINTTNGGFVYLIAPNVENNGVIHAPNGDVLLAAGQSVEIADGLNPALRVVLTAPEGSVINLGQILAESGRIGLHAGLVSNSGTVSASSAIAEGGKIYLRAKTVDLQGSLEANGATSGGSIRVDGEVIFQTAALQAEGARGGDVSLTADRILQAGAISAQGREGQGGQISVSAATALVQTAAGVIDVSGSSQGGSIDLQARDGQAFLSGTLLSKGSTGGEIRTLGQRVVLAAATLDASGTQQGGTVLVGGDFQGSNPAVQNAQTVSVNPSTRIDVSAKADGSGGKAIIWSEQETVFAGTVVATGGTQSGDGGFVEVSGKENLAFGGFVDASAAHGRSGTLLLDPKNIMIDASAGGGSAYISLADPNPAAGDAYGSGSVTELGNGNLAVGSPGDDFGGTDAGALFLFNRSTGGLLSALYGATSGDFQSAGITSLSNGNFVLMNPYWNNGAVVDAGAVTRGSTTTGISGVISAAISLVGSSTNDRVGSKVQVGSESGQTVSNGVTALANGNYLVSSRNWDNGGITDAGAVTWGSGSTGITGVVSAANSLVGSTASDAVGSGGILALSNNNYVVRSQFWDNAGVANAGAVTWGNGSSGTAGVVSASNSLVGSSTDDFVGFVVALSSGNYLVASSLWDNNGLADAGAVTWGSGSTGVSGVISAGNSLVGSRANDRVGYDVTTLTNGNFVVSSPFWNNGATATVGAATWFNGATGQMANGVATGVISASNSLIGSSAGDAVGDGGGLTALVNGNYVVASQSWDNGTILNAGAVTWGSGTSGIVGLVSANNSLVGDHGNDQLGAESVIALASGNYLVPSPNWFSNRGAATWGDGTTGRTGVISSSSSLVGSAAGTAGDFVGNRTYTLTNGNVVIVSDSWSGSRGAVTWINGANGQLSDGTTAGAVSASNSLVGSTINDEIGTDYFSNGITVLTNGNYVVQSPYWNNGGRVSSAGAVTWVNGATGRLADNTTGGAISVSNSLVGTTAGDQIGFDDFVTALSNGNYVVQSPYWDNGTTADVGAVTWGNGATGSVGTVSVANSLVGTVAGQNLGYYGEVIPLTQGSYIVAHEDWNNRAGSVTWVNGSNGQLLDGATGGVIDAAHSLLGSSASDRIGSAVLALGNGNAVVSSSAWSDPVADLISSGSVTWINGSTGRLADGATGGAISSTNSLLGTTSNAQVGVRVSALTNGNYLVASPNWNGNVGALTWADGSTGLVGTISGSNSLLGTAGEYLASNGTTTLLSQGHYTVGSSVWSTNTGRVVLGLGTVAGTGTVDGSLFSNTSDSGVNYSMTPTMLTSILNAGTNLVLQANNDLTITSAIATDNPSGNGGALTLQAGRSILLNASISTDNGKLTLSANDASASSGNRDAGVANINVASGVAIDSGTGALAATIGSGVTGGTANVGAFTNAGTLSVGSGSSISAVFNNTGVFNVTNGTLSLLAGGTNNGTFNLAGTGSISLPNSGNGYPTFANAAGGVLNINSTTGGWSFVSDSGTQGGIVNNTGTININTGYTSWEAAFTNSGSGVLNIAAGNALSMQNGQTLQGNITLGAGSTLWVSERHGANASFNGTTISGSGTVQVAAGSGPVADFTNVSAPAATLLVGNGGTANVLAGTTTFASLNMTGGTLSGAGTLNVSTTLTQTGGTQSGSGSTVLGSTATGTLTAASLSRGLTNQGTLNLSQTTLSGLLDNSGTLNATTGTNSVSGAFTQSGILDVASGASFVKSGGFANTGTIRGKGLIDVGSTGTLTNTGTVRPGASPGTLTITGNYIQGPSGTLFMELGGTTQGVDYDWLDITGTASLGGTLQVDLFGSFVPVAGNAFGLISAAGGVSGTFSQTNTPVGYSFTSVYGANFFNLDLLSVVAPPVSTGMPASVNTILAAIDNTVNLGAVSYETPLLYITGQSSPTASSSGTLTQTAEIVLPNLMPLLPDEPASGTGATSGNPAFASLIPLFDQLVRDAIFKDAPHDSRLICR